GPVSDDRQRPRLPARALDPVSRKAARPPRLGCRSRRRRRRLGLRPQQRNRNVSNASTRPSQERLAGMSATKILWGQIITVFMVILLALWTATEWTAWRLGFQSELGRPWVELLHFPIYQPQSFFWWMFAFDAYAPSIFIQGAYIAASGGLIAAAVAIGMSVWRAREAKNVETYGSARWAQAKEIDAAGLLGTVRGV